MPKDFTFRVDLTHDGNSFQNQDEIEIVASTKDLYLPIGAVGLPLKKLKHGETFVVSGVEGANLKKLIEQGRVVNVVFETPGADQVTSGLLFGVSEEGIFAMRFDGETMSIGGMVYTWQEEFLTDLNVTLAASDGENNFVLISSFSGEYYFMKVEPDGTTSLIEIAGLSVDDLDNPESMTYIGDNKIALCSDSRYIVFTTTGELLVNRLSFGFDTFSDIVYFQGEVYGFGTGNSLYYVNKDTGEVFGEGNIELKQSRTLTWKAGSLEYEISSMYSPFVFEDRLFAVVFPSNVEDFNQRLVEVFPDTDEINHISFYEIDIDSILAMNFTEDRSTETGFSTGNFNTNHYEFEVYYYHREIWIDEQILYKEPTLSNLVVEYGNYNDFFANQDPGWTPLTLTSVTYSEQEHEWTVEYTEPEEEFGLIMRMRYADGDGDFWTYIRED